MYVTLKTTFVVLEEPQPRAAARLKKISNFDQNSTMNAFFEGYHTYYIYIITNKNSTVL
ncbi:hypothetical protein [Chryseobacterium suipulveris]|uniref:hypothetical protein n=1 Tax=Chryseobacterium suipulveris TaxID=2929800 RepID=UPI002950067E|nr:hypothetical protein [Chryseobacterium suipulveris]